MNRDRERDVLRRLDTETWVALAAEMIPDLKQRGPHDYWARCPLRRGHQDRGETLHVDPGMFIFKCFGAGCELRGGPVQLLARVKQISESEAVDVIAKRIGLD